MRRIKTMGLIALLTAMVVTAVGVVPAAALETPAGTTISNSATVDYSVGGNPQTAIPSSPTGNNDPAGGVPTTFVVDDKVDLTTADAIAAAVLAAPGDTVIFTFNLTNTGNTTHQFSIAAANQPNGTAYLGSNDTFDVTSVQVWYENGGAGFDPGTDINSTLIPALAPSTIQTVYIVAVASTAQVDGDYAVVSLTAVADDGTGNPLAEDPTPNQAGTVQVVWADGAGAIVGSTDGTYSAYGAFRIQAAQLTITKAASVESDPFNGASNPKAIPGATVRFTITVENTGTAAATGGVVTDTVPGDTTFVAGSINAEAGSGFAGGVVTMPLVSPLTSGSSDTVGFSVTID